MERLDGRRRTGSPCSFGIKLGRSACQCGHFRHRSDVAKLGGAAHGQPAAFCNRWLGHASLSSTNGTGISTAASGKPGQWRMGQCGTLRLGRGSCRKRTCGSTGRTFAVGYFCPRTDEACVRLVQPASRTTSAIG